MSSKDSVNSFGARDTLKVGDQGYEIYRLDAVPGTEKLPYSLKVLAENLLRTEDGEAVYRRCSDTHHHHLVCRECGATVEIEGPAVERWTSAMAAEHGFADVSHTLEIFGTCPACR